MKRRVTVLLVVLLSCALALPALAAKKEAVFGGNGDDIACGILALKDGGYLIYGSTTSTDGDFARGEGAGKGRVPWAMKLDGQLQMQWNALLPDGEGQLASVHDACETEDGRIALLADLDGEGAGNRLFLLTREGELHHQQSLDMDHGVLCAIGNGIAAAGRCILEDGKHHRLMLAQMFFEDDRSRETTFRYEAQRGVALMEKDGVLWLMAEVKGEEGNCKIVTLDILDREQMSIGSRQVWSRDGKDLTGLGAVPYGDTAAFIGLTVAGEGNSKEDIRYEEKEHDGRYYLSVTPGQADTLCAAVFYEGNNFCVLGYRGDSGGDIPADGDVATAYYRDKPGNFIRTYTKKTTPGGLRFVDGIREENSLRLLGMKTTTKKGVDVFIDDWAYQKK